MFKKYIFHKRTWSTLIVAIHITGTNCVSSHSLPTPTPTTTTTIDDHPDHLHRSTESLDSEDSSSSGVSSGYASSGSSSGYAPSGPSSGYVSSGSSSGHVSSGLSSRYVSSGPSSGHVSSGPSSGHVSSGPSSGSSYSAVPPPPLSTLFAGLPNVGNTCYMNASLQIIAALYADKVPNGVLKDLISKINTTHRPLKESDMHTFIGGLPLGAQEMARSGRHQDAQEFIWKLNQDKNCSFLDTSLEVTSRARYSDPNILGFLEKVDISALFPMLLIPFAKESCGLSEMIKLHQTRTMDDDSISQTLYNLPERLCILLGRNVNFSGKIIDKVDGTMNITIQPDPDLDYTVAFALNGCIVHHGGGAKSGHYTAYVKRAGQWYQVNDEDIKEVEEPAVNEASAGAYLFFYTKQ